MPFAKIKLRYRLIGLLAGITAVSFILAMSQTIIRLQNIQKNNALLQEQRIAQNIASDVTEFISLQFTRLDTIDSIFPFILADLEFQENFFNHLLFSNDMFEELSMVDKYGKEITRVSRTKTIRPENLTDYSKSENFLKVKENGKFISPVFWERNRPFFTIGQIINAPQGDPFSFIFAQVDARAIQNAIKKSSTLKEGEHAYIVDKQGVVVAHPDISPVLLQKDFSSIKMVGLLIATSPQDFITDIYDNDLGQKVIGTGSAISLSFEGEFKETLATDWFIITEISTFIAFSSVREITLFSLLVLLIILLFSVVAATLFARRIVKPIEVLYQGAKEIGLGNLDYDFVIKTNDELQDLGEEFHRMSQRLKETREREENLSKMKSEFVSIAAHQLRTPIAGTKWSLKMLLGGDLGKISKNQKELLERTYKGNERMIHLINDLLNVARIEEGKYAYNQTMNDLEVVVRFVINACQEVIKNKAINLEMPKLTRKLPLIRMDVEKIKLVVQNLLDNAIKYANQGGGIYILLEYDIKNEEVIFSIEDTGLGISKADQPRVFSKFFRGIEATRTDTEGSGLGLYLAKNIIEAHGGRIWFKSEEKKGSTFYFAIPVKKV